jgi:uncharacterized protein
VKGFRLSVAGLLAAFCLAALPAAAQVSGVPPAPDRWATDRAGFLSAAALSALDARLEAFERETGRQVLVYIDRTTGETPIEDFAVRAFEAWKVGRKGLDDGAVLFVMADDRKLRLEVGYGLEPVVTDLRASRIIRDVIVPRLQAGDNDGAVTEGTAALLGTIAGESYGSPVVESESASSSPGRRGSDKANKILIIVGVIFFLILFITNPRLALFLLWTFMSGGRGGGGGGGGFRGGGGRSGGGGASGSW